MTTFIIFLGVAAATGIIGYLLGETHGQRVGREVGDANGYAKGAARGWQDGYFAREKWEKDRRDRDGRFSSQKGGRS